MKYKLNRFTFTILDMAIIIMSFMVVAWIKPATIKDVLPQYAFPFTVFAFIWLFFSSIGEKYRIHEEKSFVQVLIKILIINFAIIATIFLILILFKLSFSRLILFGTISLATFGELIIFFAIYYTRRFFIDNPSFARTPMVTEFSNSQNIEEINVEEIEERYDILHRYEVNKDYVENIENSLMMALLKNYLDHQERVFEFLNNNVALANISKYKATVLNTSTLYNVEHLGKESQEFIMNIHPMNDYRRINKFIKAINSDLKKGGVFVGCAETLEERAKRFIKKRYPRIIRNSFLFFDFVINRAFPKISFLKGIYFAITKGRNRPLSKCEILGRLYFCGFKVISTKEIHNRLFFIVKKIKEPSKDLNPSYAPIFKMKRRGKNGKQIYIYKFRTMHPYAEYLQHYMVENFGYGDKGKVDNDFRITKWGKWMRRLWLDELPQLLNFLKGDLGIVGVRPLSERFLKEYPQDLKEKRFKYKPGCIPPYVALKMQAVEQYLESERIYLAEKEKHPLWTDIKYFWWAVYNILTNKIRSE